MANKSPPETSKILATPIENIEESRALRLQRQQSRFRDRGGIFIPSSRNTLIDILLGRASPVKKSRRSVSASPSKGRGNSKPRSLVPETPVGDRNLRRSPRKKGRESSGIKGESTGINNRDSKISLHGARKSTAGQIALTSLPCASFEPDPSETSISIHTNKAVSRVSDTGDSNAALPKKSSTKRKPPSKATKTPVFSRNKSTGETAEGPEDKDDAQLDKLDKNERNKLKPKKQMASETYEEEGRPKTTSSRVTRPAIPKASSSVKSTRTRNKTDAKEQGVTTRSKTKKKTASSGAKSSASLSAPPRESKSKLATPQLPDIMEEDEEDLSDDSQAPPLPSKSSSQREERKTAQSNPGIGAKRTTREEDPSVGPPEPPRKRARAAAKDVPAKAMAKGKAKPRQTTQEDPPAPRVTRKRRRAADPDGDHADDSDDRADVRSEKRVKGVKQKKVQDKSAPLKPKKEVSKPASKIQSSKRRTPTRTAKRKENVVVPASASTEKQPSDMPARKGLPKSIQLRIQNSSVPHVVDDEPDPIDFLS